MPLAAANVGSTRRTFSAVAAAAAAVGVGAGGPIQSCRLQKERGELAQIRAVDRPDWERQVTYSGHQGEMGERERERGREGRKRVRREEGESGKR